MSKLASLPNSQIGGEALSVSDDGSLVVGFSYNEFRETAVMWSADDAFSVVDLNEFLDNNGVDRAGWYLEQATAVSGDGSTITGWARFDADGHTEAFRLQLNAAVASSWAGFPVEPDGRNVNTGSFIGWIDIGSPPWVWSYSLSRFIYLPEGNVSESGAWSYVPNQ